MDEAKGDVIMFQSVYIISNKNGFYKIGVSNSAVQRLKTLATGNPCELEIKFVSKPIKNASVVEHFLHKHFAESRVNGEWFYFDNIDSVISKTVECVNEMGDFSNEIPISQQEAFKQLDKFFGDVLLGYKNGLAGLQMEIESLRRKTEQERWENATAHEFLDCLAFGKTGGLYMGLIYKSLFGKPLKELQEEYRVKPKESIRDYLTAEQLKDVESMEMLVSGLINCGWGYDQIKNFLETNHLKQLAG